MATQKHLLCPECRFPNMPGSATCLTCKAPLPTRAEPRGSGRLGMASTERFVVHADGTIEQKPRPEVRDLGDVSDSLRRRTVAWLTCAPFDPIPLGPLPQLRIGRDKACDLCLPHPGVSRQHAVLRVLGRTIHLEDTSTYGTLVNGVKTQTRELRPGDRIAIGPYELRISGVGRENDPSASKGDGTREIRVDHGARQPMVMSGSLEMVPPIELLQGLEFNQKTGTLRVVTPEGLVGAVVVEEGRPLAAKLGQLQGDEAVLAIAQLRAGEFQVLAQLEQAGPTAASSLTELLLEANRRLDESGVNDST